MQNVALFNDFVLQIFDHLYDRFPVPCAINPEDFIAKVEFSPYPPCPVSTYCGPDRSWLFSSKKEQYEKMWAAHPWEATVSETETLLSRTLTDSEKDVLLRTGKRPVTPEEQQLLDDWVTEKARIDSLRETQKSQREEAETKQTVFIATLQFLNSERLIRFVDIPPPTEEGRVLNPPDILIQKATKRLRFVLTSNGFTHLNRTFMGGKLSEEMTLYQAIKRTLKEKAVEGAGAAGTQALVGWILS
jgi:hypothetical protein